MTPFATGGNGLRHKERGAILIITAGAMVAILAFAAVAIDLGYQRAARRDMQALADVVALDTVRLVDGRSALNIVNGSEGKQTLGSLKEDTLERNDDTLGSDPEVYLQLGTWDPSTEIFTVMWDERTGVYTPANGSGIPTHVRAYTSADTPALFDLGGSGSGVNRSAMAARSPQELARFKLGSSLVSMNPQTNSLVGQLLNSVIPGASVLSWQGLVGADITLEALGLALGIPLTTMSPDELLNTNVSMNTFTVAMATALQNSGGGAAAINAMNSLIALGVPATQVNLGEVLGVTAGEGDPALNSTVALSTLLTSTIIAIDGDHALSLPGTTLNIPGLSSVGIQLTGIEAPREGGNGEGASATTSQVHLEVTPVLNLAPGKDQNICALPPGEQNLLQQLLGGILNLLTCLLGGILNRVLSVQVTGALPITVDLAQVTASQHIDCAHRQVTVTPTPSAIKLTGAVNLDVSASLAGSPLGNLLHLGIPVNTTAQGTSAPITFTASGAGTPTPFGTKWTTFTPATARVGANPLGLGGLLQIGTASLQVLNLNLSALSNIVIGLVQPALNQVFGQLDTLVLQPLAQLLGLNLGGSDITPLWLQCDRSSVALVG